MEEQNTFDFLLTSNKTNKNTEDINEIKPHTKSLSNELSESEAFNSDTCPYIKPDLDLVKIENIENMSQDALKQEIPSCSTFISEVKEEIMYCQSCSYSDVDYERLKFHIFREHPISAAVVANTFDEANYNLYGIKLFCVKESCTFSSTSCKVYEDHLMNCCQMHQTLPRVEKERLKSTLKFILDLQNRHNLSTVSRFLDYISSFKTSFKCIDDKIQRSKDSDYNTSTNVSSVLQGSVSILDDSVKCDHSVTHLENPISLSPTPVLLFTSQTGDLNSIVDKADCYKNNLICVRKPKTHDEPLRGADLFISACASMSQGETTLVQLSNDNNVSEDKHIALDLEIDVPGSPANIKPFLEETLGDKVKPKVKMANRKKCNQHEPRWTTENLKLAIQAVKDGMGKRKAAVMYNIPWSTFCDKLSGRRRLVRTRKTVLTVQEEEEILQWLRQTNNRGFSRTKDDFLSTVKTYLDSKGRSTPWVNNMPGRTWFQLFRKRHKDFTFKKPQKLGTPRISKEKVLNWFQKFTEDIKAIDPTVLLEPERIYNADESGFHLDESSERVIAFSGSKHVFQMGNEKTLITALVCCSAADHFTHPMVIYPGMKFCGFRPQDMFKESFITKTKQGWIDGDTFADWIENILIPQTEHIKKPILLLVDRHRSHQTLRASTLCQDNGIILYCILPHSSHILQPLDIGIFPSMKKAWKDAVRKETQSANIVTMKNFAVVFKQAYENTISKGLAREAFRKAGIFPCDPNNIKWSKVMDFQINCACGCYALKTPSVESDSEDCFSLSHESQAASSHDSEGERNTPQYSSMKSQTANETMINSTTEPSTDTKTPSSSTSESPSGTSQSEMLKKILLLTAQMGEDTLRLYFQRFENQESSDDPIYQVWSSYYKELSQKFTSEQATLLENRSTASATANNFLVLPKLKQTTTARKSEEQYPNLNVLIAQIVEKQKEDERKVQRKKEMEERKKAREKEKEEKQRKKEERKRQQEEETKRGRNG